HDERALHRDEAAQPRVAALQLLHDEAVGDAAQAGEAVIGDAGAEEVQAPHLEDQLEGGARLAVALLDDRFDLVVDELAHGLADQALLVREERVELDEINAWEAAQGASSF